MTFMFCFYFPTFVYTWRIYVSKHVVGKREEMALFYFMCLDAINYGFGGHDDLGISSYYPLLWWTLGVSYLSSSHTPL